MDKFPLFSKTLIGGLLMVFGVLGHLLATNEIGETDIAFLGLALSLIGLRFKLSNLSGALNAM